MNAFDIGLRAQMARVIDGELSAAAFRRWFLPLAWSEAEDGYLQSPLARKVELRLAEYANGHWSEEDLKILFIRELPATSSPNLRLVNVTYQGTVRVKSMPVVVESAQN